MGAGGGGSGHGAPTPGGQPRAVQPSSSLPLAQAELKAAVLAVFAL